MRQNLPVALQARRPNHSKWRRQRLECRDEDGRPVAHQFRIVINTIKIVGAKPVGGARHGDKNRPRLFERVVYLDELESDRNAVHSHWRLNVRLEPLLYLLEVGVVVVERIALVVSEHINVSKAAVDGSNKRRQQHREKR